MPKEKRKVSLKNEWLSQYKWMAISKRGQHFMYCKACGKDMSISNGGLTDVKRHNESASHVDLMRLQNEQVRIAQFMVKRDLGEQKLEEDVATAEALFCHFLVEHNLPFALGDHAGDLFRRMFPDSKIAKQFKCGRTKATAIVKQALGPRAMEETVGAMKEGPFSLLMDESNDICNEKDVALLVRYFDSNKSKVVVKFFGIPVCNIATGATLYSVVNDQFSKHDIPWDNLVGFGSDNASVMLGKRNSVLSRLREKQPHLYNLGCVCHVAHTCSKNAAEALGHDVEKLVIDIYYYFDKSSKRDELFRTYQEFTEVPTHRVLKHGSTRWLSLERCIDRTLEQWPALTSYFTSEADNRTAEKIQERLADHEMKLYFLFLQVQLPIFNKFNLLFQAEQANIYLVASRQTELLKTFLRKFLKPDHLAGNADPVDVSLERENQLDNEDLFIGQKARAYIETEELEGTTELRRFYQYTRAYFVKGASSIKKKFPFKDDVLKGMEVLDPAKREEASTVQVQRLLERFPNAIPEGKEDTLFEEWLEYKSMEVSDKLLDKGQTPVDTFWGTLDKEKIDGQPRFQVLPKFMKFLLCMPHSNADTERIFSCVSHIKTPHRSSLCNSTLSSLLVVKRNTDSCCYQVQFSKSDLAEVKSATYDYLRGSKK